MDAYDEKLPSPVVAPQTPPTRAKRQRATWVLLGAVLLILHLWNWSPLLALKRRPLPPVSNPHNRTVVLISIDGFRADYINKGLTPHLVEHGKRGIQAEWMRPIFPTLTFPNHWALMTGLYAESHGIIANTFWDPVTDAYFDYTNPERSWGAHWWLGEPIWATAERAGIRSANLMWPGPPVTSTGIRPSYFIPWRNQVPLSEKLAQINEWLALPAGERPNLIVMYDPAVDQAGHSNGLRAACISDALAQITLEAVDEFARDVPKDVDVIFVSDHGMTDTSKQRLLFLDDPELLGGDAARIVHHDGWPSMGLRFSEEADIPGVVARLQAYAEANPMRFKVYTASTMPERWHFNPLNSERIAPVWIVPELGWGVGLRSGGSYPVKGNHGFDNAEPSMRAMLAAAGPSFAPRNGTVIPGFQNTEVYGLVARLLGIERWASPHNGTAGFWDTLVDA
ncbi:Phosphodiest-domain-containing protein [Auricularia subglabra TFB-10046 SS5]|nr:Phosphodiest-domain-containing protein [Auricularia subglabra TFB-10046 SS5]